MKNNKRSLHNPHLTIGWLYPELMSTYGDRGNVMVLQKRIEWHGVKANIARINHNSGSSTLNSVDLLFMGGAQDIQQEIVQKDLLKNKGTVISKMIEDNIPGLFICGAYQILGNYYKDAYGKKINGIGLFNMYTESPIDKTRLVGTTVIKPKIFSGNQSTSSFLVGFENHGGRTYISDKSLMFGSVINGFGNNGKDKTEGIHYMNAIGTYLHGPILPSNPELADYLIEKAYRKKYGQNLSLKKIDDSFAHLAKMKILKRMNIAY